MSRRTSNLGQKAYSASRVKSFWPAEEAAGGCGGAERGVADGAAGERGLTIPVPPPSGAYLGAPPPPSSPAASGRHDTMVTSLRPRDDDELPELDRETFPTMPDRDWLSEPTPSSEAGWDREPERESGPRSARDTDPAPPPIEHEE